MKQKLFIGENYCNGINSKKIMVVGHQQHATQDEKNCKSEFDDEENTCKLMKELITGVCMEWEPSDRKSWLQFVRILTGNRSLMLGTQESANVLNSIAFCNFIQIPDFNLEERQGKDNEIYYQQGLKIFMENIEEAKPNKIIVWGNYSYPYISSLGKEIDKDRCLITLLSGEKVDVLRIPHPCRLPKGGYDYIIPVVSSFINDN